MLLLKCLKVMENATFLSTKNQNHLLGFNKSMGSHGTRRSFTELMISVIKILSGLQLCARRNEKNPYPRRVSGVNTESMLGAKCKVNKEVVTISSDTWSITSCSSMRSASVSERNRSAFLLDCSVTSMSGYQSSVVSINDSCMLTTRAGSNTGSFAGRFASLGSGISRSNACQVRKPICKKVGKSGSLEDSQDPYTFDLEDSGPSKRAAEESSDRDRNVTEQPYSTYDIDKGCLCLLSDCLLTAVKVLMNLTNENFVGCWEVAGHFPSFTRSPLFSKLEMPGTRHPKKKHLTEEELDFLVAILGLLVNLVEEDGTIRARLAAASVPIIDPEGLQESEQDMIPLLCSIFLTNQASSDTTEETSTFTLDDEEAVLQSEKEAEKMIVEAYSALLLAFLSTQKYKYTQCHQRLSPKTQPGNSRTGVG